MDASNSRGSVRYLRDMSPRIAAVLIAGILAVNAQTPRASRTEADGVPRQTMKQLVRGAEYAAASMAPLATITAEHMLQAGGNAFDAIVAGQAVLGLVQPSANGLGSDAQLLVYDTKQKKAFSLDAEGTAPKLATIEWYKANSGGKIPGNDSLLAGTGPGLVDAWYVLLSRWGTKNFADVLAPAIELAERGVPLGRALNVRGLSKYPSSVRVYGPDGKVVKDGGNWKNPGLACPCA